MASTGQCLRAAFAQRPKKPYVLQTAAGAPLQDFEPDAVAVFTLPSGETATLKLSDPSGYDAERANKVGDILFFIHSCPEGENARPNFGTYTKEALDRNLDAVSRIETSKVIAWLQTAETEDVERIDKPASREAPKEVAAGVKRPADTKADDAFSKKLRPATDDDTLAVRDILSRERTIEDRRTCLSSKGTGKGFENVRKIGLALIEKLSSGVPIGPSAGGSSSSSKPGPPTSRSAPAPARPGTSSSSAAKGGQQRVYVILPSSTSSMLQLYNANAFFNEKTFVPVTPELVQSMSKPQFVDVRRTKADGTPIVFRFIDSAVSLKAEEWPKVVAVFAQGQKWQFSHFRWREPTDVFHNTRGFFVKYQDEALKEPVKDWNVVTLNLSRSKRHQDSQVVADFWKSLTEWLKSRKPEFV